jgi:hypothetical protein
MDTAPRAKWLPLVEHLRRIFGERLEALVSYGRDGHNSSLALVQSMDADDLASCARLVRQWHQASLATPLIVTSAEFARSLDAFPLEYAEVQQTAVVVEGYNPFERFGSIRSADLRRACELQANSHLLHLREDYIDCGAAPREVAALVTESAPAFAMILRQMSRLDGRAAETPRDLGLYAEERIGLDARVVGDVLALMDRIEAGTVDATRLFPEYLNALDQLARFVDKWKSE